MSGASLRGHPLHPILAAAPMALLASSAALDVAALLQPSLESAAAARWALGASFLSGIVAAIPGVLDARALPPAARGVPIRHGIANGTALLAMLAGWWIRPTGAAPGPAALALSVVAVGAAWLGWRIGRRLTPAPRRRVADHSGDAALSSRSR